MSPPSYPLSASSFLALIFICLFEAFTARLEMENSRHSPPPPDFEQAPTIFLRATPENFRELVQRYTGMPGPQPIVAVPPNPIPDLQDRRALMRKLRLNMDLVFASAGNPDAQLPWVPMTPRVQDQEPPRPITPLTSGASSSSTIMTDEEHAIADKGFYLYPSLPMVNPPELLQLFPGAPSGSESDDSKEDDHKGKKVQD